MAVKQWEETVVIDHGRTGAVGKKGPSHPDDILRERFNQYGEPKVPGCWTAVMKRQGRKSNPY